MPGLVLATAPTVEPVTLSDARLHLKIPSAETSDDTYITALIVVARRSVERFQGRALINQTWDYYLDRFPIATSLADGHDRWIEVPRPPLSSVTHVKYTPEGGALTTFASSNYTVDTASTPGRIVLKRTADWPSTVLEITNGVVIRFIAGYGAAAANVPENTVHALKMLVSHLYENREVVAIGSSVVPIPMAIQSLLWEESSAKWA